MKTLIRIVTLLSFGFVLSTANAAALCGQISKMQYIDGAGYNDWELTIDGQRIKAAPTNSMADSAVLTTAIANNLKVCLIPKVIDGREYLTVGSVEK